MGPKTARLTVLLEPSRKVEFEQACQEIDMTPSQVVRGLIREWLGRDADRAQPRSAVMSARAVRPKRA